MSWAPHPEWEPSPKTNVVKSWGISRELTHTWIYFAIKMHIDALKPWGHSLPHLVTGQKSASSGSGAAVALPADLGQWNHSPPPWGEAQCQEEQKAGRDGGRRKGKARSRSISVHSHSLLWISEKFICIWGKVICSILHYLHEETWGIVVTAFQHLPYKSNGFIWLVEPNSEISLNDLRMYPGLLITCAPKHVLNSHNMTITNPVCPITDRYKH